MTLGMEVGLGSSDLTAWGRPEVEISRSRFCKYSLFDVITLVMGKTNI